MPTLTTTDVYHWLEDVKDPEIPVLSLVDSGVVNSVTIVEGKVLIEMTPTFVGCPALDMMKQEIHEVLKKNGVDKVEIKVSFKEPWSSDKISEKGKAALKKFGLAPPPSREVFVDLEVLEH